MRSESSDHFRGIHAATVCPLLPNGSIDEHTLAAHLYAVSRADGITGLLINGHAGENFMFGREDKRPVVEIARQACSAHTLLVCGINVEDSLEAQRHVDDAAQAGADAVLVFPPFSWALSQDADVAVRHRRIATANSRLQLFLYQAGVRAGTLGYTADALARLVQLPNVIGIKEGSWENAAYEANRRMVQRVAPHVMVMASGDEHLLTCFAVGTDGSLVSLACITPELVVGLYRAMEAGDLAAARAFNDRIYPLAKAIYGTAPGGHANARLKACLKLLGRIPSDAMRPPMGPLPADEVAMFDESVYDSDDFSLATYVMTPPLRNKESQDALWTALKTDDLQLISTDHCPFCMKEGPPADFFGNPQHERTRLFLRQLLH